jgi:pantothenate kinase type III
MAAGSYWGALGAVRELAARMAATLPTAPEVYLTGGASTAFAADMARGEWAARHVPHLVLSGIRLAVAEPSAT